MKTALFTFIFLASSTILLSHAKAQFPSMQDLSRNVDQAALNLEEKQNTFLGFKKLELPKPISKIFDIRFKRPEFPKFGVLEKLKDIGKPKFGNEAPTQGPFLSNLSKMFQPRAKSQSSLIDRMLGKFDPAGSDASAPAEADLNELTTMTNGLQQHVDRMSQEANANTSDLFSNLETSGSPQPPLRSAREYSGESTSRF